MAEDLGVLNTGIEELVVKVEPICWENGHDDEMEMNVVPIPDGSVMNHKSTMAIVPVANVVGNDSGSFPIHSAQGELYTPVEVSTSRGVIKSVEKIKVVYRNVGTLTNSSHHHETVSAVHCEKINTSRSDTAIRDEHSFSIGSSNKTLLDFPSHSSLTEVCLQCERVCKNKYALKSHMRIHDKEKWHKCPVCSKSFYKQSDLVRHTRLHTGDKPYVCEVCGKSFSDPSYFRQHNRFHEGIKPHKCSFCKAAFTHKSHLTTHRRSHSGEKPFRCNLCDKTFGRRDYLKSHVLTHSGVKSFHCSFCDKSFSKSSHLKAHVRSHTKEKPYGCDICPSHFTRRSDVTRHRLRQHKGASRA